MAPSLLIITSFSSPGRRHQNEPSKKTKKKKMKWEWTEEKAANTNRDRTVLLGISDKYCSVYHRCASSYTMLLWWMLGALTGRSRSTVWNKRRKRRRRRRRWLTTVYYNVDQWQFPCWQNHQKTTRLSNIISEEAAHTHQHHHHHHRYTHSWRAEEPEHNTGRRRRRSACYGGGSANHFGVGNVNFILFSSLFF